MNPPPLPKKIPLVLGLCDVRNGADYTLSNYFLCTIHMISTPMWLLRRNGKVREFFSAFLEMPFDASYMTVSQYGIRQSEIHNR